VTTGVRSGTELTRLIGLHRADSIDLRQDGSLAGRNEGLARKSESEPKGNEG
jgi:hypothetical protein